jgi:hypothetical protein
MNYEWVLIYGRISIMETTSKLTGPVPAILHPAHGPLAVLQKSKPNNQTYICRVSQALNSSNYPYIPQEENA